MTRNHNQLAWDAIEQLACHYQDDERRDYESEGYAHQDGHIYEAWVQLNRWVTRDKEEAQRGHNGWSNYETWIGALWHDNEEQRYRLWQEVTRECYRVAENDPGIQLGGLSVYESAQLCLAKRLNETLTEEISAGVVGFAADLLGAAMSRIDWQELAGHLLTTHINREDEIQMSPPEASSPIGKRPIVVGLQKFEPGIVTATPGAMDAVSHEEMTMALCRHLSGDWGELSDSDRDENDLSLREGYRILSAFRTGAGDKFWIITEADRSATTVLLPEEY